jgi:ParB family chromosome partitioning protein
MAKRAKDTLDYLAVLAQETTTSLEAAAARGKLTELPLESIVRSPYQSRQDFDQAKLTELANTIREHGVLQPVIVRARQSGYELVTGERRWRAAQLAGIVTIPAIVRDVDDDQAAALILVENLQRSDLNPIEEAEGYQTLMSRGLSQQAVATAVGKSVSAISRMIGLLKLDESIKEWLQDGQLEYAHGRALLSIPRTEQFRLAQMAVRRGWGSRQLEMAARKVKEKLEDDKRRGRRLVHEDPDIARLRDRISDRLGTKIEFKAKAKGAGQLVIHYTSATDCNRILEELNLVGLSDVD